VLISCNICLHSRYVVGRSGLTTCPRVSVGLHSLTHLVHQSAFPFLTVPTDQSSPFPNYSANPPSFISWSPSPAAILIPLTVKLGNNFTSSLHHMVGLRSLANTVHTNTVERLAAGFSPVAASAIELDRCSGTHASRKV
jgi:hypothetical protein